MSIFLPPPSAPDCTFRLATSDDALCIGVLGTQVFLDTYAPIGIRPILAREVLVNLSTEATAEKISKPDSKFILVERAGHLLAFAQMTLDSPHPLLPARRCVELNRLYVQEKSTGTGIGRALLAEAEDRAAAEGADAMWLTAWVGNARALAFYPRCGYTDIGTTQYVFENESHENRIFAKQMSTLSDSNPAVIGVQPVV